MATLLIPTQLRGLTNGASEIAVGPAKTVREALRAAAAQHEGFGAQIFDERGELRRFVHVFVGDEHIRGLDGLESSLTPHDEISIVPAVAGGMS